MIEVVSKKTGTTDIIIAVKFQKVKITIPPIVHQIYSAKCWEE